MTIKIKNGSEYKIINGVLYLVGDSLKKSNRTITDDMLVEVK